MRAFAHNTTDAGGAADVRFEVDETARAAEQTRRIDLPAHGTVAIDIPIEVVGAGLAHWRWAITSGDNSDAVEATINVRDPAPLIRQVETKRLEADSAELVRIADPQILEGKGEV